MPASIAPATGAGMRSISAPTGRNMAASRIRPAATRNAPTAPGRVMPSEAAISAAPGVDQAVMIGMRCVTLRKVLVAAMLEAQRRHPGGGLGRAGARRPGRGDDEGDRAAEPDKRRDEGGGDDRQAHRRDRGPAGGNPAV